MAADLPYHMSSPLFPGSLPRARRHVAWLVAIAIMLAGIAQAAHYHKAEIARGTTDVHCLLCLFAGAQAGPPAIAQVLQGAARYYGYRFPVTSVCPPNHHPAPYQARGPPLG
jgi:hypothetical protein